MQAVSQQAQPRTFSLTAIVSGLSQFMFKMFDYVDKSHDVEEIVESKPFKAEELRKVMLEG